jgi:uncharacterized protein
MYLNGEGVPQDFGKAISYLETSANQGSSLGQFSLGQIYYSGQGVPIDYPKSAEWFKKAADQGHDGAQFNLGVMYEEGRGVEKNVVEAHKWLNLAGAQGEKDAVSERTALEDEMSKDQIVQAQEAARDWLAAHTQK